MAIAAYTYAKMNLNALKGRLPDLSAAETIVKVTLLNDNYAPAQNRHEVFTAPAWNATTEYSNGDYVIPTTATGNIYKCTAAGTSGETEPTWPITDAETIEDAGITWECVASGDIAFYEISGDGYTSGGTEITNKTLQDIGGAVFFRGDDVQWSESTIIARYAVIYETGSNILLAYQDFGENKATSNTEFNILWHGDGIVIITALQPE